MNANQNNRKAILVTGAHRSGTTWVGKMLAASRQAAYISEPLNRWHRPGVFSAPVRHWYTYICHENEEAFLPAFHQLLNFRYHLAKEILSLRSTKDFLRLVRDSRAFLSGRIFRRRPLMKDPFAFFSAPWLAETFGCSVVITVRHPAAFVSSLKRLDWPFDFSDLAQQPLLVRDWIGPFQPQMQSAITRPEDLVGNGSLLWLILYYTAQQFLQLHPDFILVKHEDLSQNPVEGYRMLYRRLGLDFSTQSQETIASSSAAENPKEIARQDIYGTRVDSLANLKNWKGRLTTAEIERIREITAGTASQYYGDSDWE